MGVEQRLRLRSHEVVIWSGPARGGVIIHAEDWLSLPLMFMLLITTVVSFLLAGSPSPRYGDQDQYRLYFVLSCIALVLGAGVLGMVRHFVLAPISAARRRSRITYVITQERVIAVDDVTMFTIAEIARLPKLTIRTGSEGGTIFLGSPPTPMDIARHFVTAEILFGDRMAESWLELGPEVREVHALLSKLSAAANPSSLPRTPSAP